LGPSPDSPGVPALALPVGAEKGMMALLALACPSPGACDLLGNLAEAYAERFWRLAEGPGPGGNSP